MLTWRNIGGAGIGEEGGIGIVVVAIDSEAEGSTGDIAEVSCETSISIVDIVCVWGDTLGDRVLDVS